MKIQTFSLSRGQLRILAFLAMLVDHTAAILLQSAWETGTLSMEKGTYSILFEVMRGIGRLAFPIFIYQMTESVQYTRCKWKYLLRLFLLGLISEVPFDLAVAGRLEPGYQNTMLEIALCCAMLLVLERIPEMNLFLRFGVCMAFGGLSEFLETDYGFAGVLLAFVLFVYRWNRLYALLIGYLVMLYEPASILAFVLLYFGRQGDERNIRECRSDGKDPSGKATYRSAFWNKWVWYVAYPLHLLVLWVIKGYITK